MQKILCVPIFACEQMFIFMPRPNAERDDSTCLAGGVGSSNTPPFLGHHSSVTFWGSIVATRSLPMTQQASGFLIPIREPGESASFSWNPALQ
jgi:hypothetical protein